jgi:hypothetical protein
MPDNTWFTPYALPNKDCLSMAVSQGIVYKLSEHHVLKMPYQYPVKDLGGIFDMDEAIEQLELSQCSIDSFKNERAFYQLLETTDSHDIVKVDVSTFEHGIMLEYLQPLETVWYTSSAKSCLRWIRQLLRANAKIEELGYTHGDLATRNMGVDKNNNLNLFDFGSVHQCSEGISSHRFIERDLSRLASCLHFLLSRIDPLADISDLGSLREVETTLENGTFAVDTVARPIEDILKSCWKKDLAAMGDVDPSMIFRHVAEAISQALDIKDGDSCSSRKVAFDQLPERALRQAETRRLLDRKCVAIDANQYDLTRDTRWMAEEQYVKAWETMGVTL